MAVPYAKLPAWVDYGLIPLVNLVVAFLVAGLVVLLVGENPIRAATLLVQGAFGTGDGIGYTLYYATNFIFTGLCVAVAFHCGLFNIGGEGQAYVGGLGVAVACLAFDSVFPWWINLPLATLCAAGVGALWALIPAYLQATRGSHIVITTIMFNFIAASLMVWLLVDVLKPEGSMAPETRNFVEGAHIPKLGWMI
ncbi:MAG: ABC transporter permease, partial [Pseudomonadota bacterium]